MRIFSNEYLSSVIGSGVNVKGGPSRFASDFSGFIVSHGHEWVGLLHDTRSREPYEELTGEVGKSFFSTPARKATHEALRELREKILPAVFFAKEIEIVSDIIRIAAPDIVFINGFSAFAWVLSAAARQVGLPFVIQHAGIWHCEVDEYADLFTSEGRALCYEMEREAAEHASANIFLNTYSRETFKQVIGAQKITDARTIPLPHTGWSFVGTFTPRSRENRVLGVVARWDRIKNHEAILCLAEAIQARKLPWHIKSVTSMPDTATKAEFKARYRECIEIIPPMNRDLLKEFYQSVDVIILPSHFDVSPTVVMEAVSVGVPTLISSNVGWVSEYQECGMSDWIADFHDPEAVLHRLQDQFLRSRWPEVARFAEYVKKWHNPDRIYSSYIVLFGKLAK